MNAEIRLLLAVIPAILLGVATTSVLAATVKQRWIWICCPFLIAIWLPVVYAFLPAIAGLLGYS